MWLLAGLWFAVCLGAGTTQRAPYTYPNHSTPKVTDLMLIQCEGGSFLQGFSFSFGASFFEFHTVTSSCYSNMTGCWPPKVEHDVEKNYKEKYNDSGETNIECLERYTPGVGTNPLKCDHGDWVSADGERGISDVCLCTESGFGDDQCAKCIAGTYSKMELNKENICTKCQAGYYSSGGESTCYKCEAGYFADSEGSPLCEACPTGTFSDSEGSVACSKCDLGYYANETASEECKMCPRGSIAITKGTTDCLVCPAGHTTYLRNGVAPERCEGPVLGMTSINDKTKELLRTELIDLGTFSDGVRVSDNQKGQWHLFSSINYVRRRYNLRLNKKYQQLPTTDSIKPVLRNVYCWVSGEEFKNSQFKKSISGAQCKQGSCSNKGQMSKEPGCIVERHKWEKCGIPKCRDSLESLLDRCHYMDSRNWGRIINLKKGHCWDGRGYPAINPGNDIGYNSCREPTDKDTTDHSYKMVNGKIISMRAELNGRQLCLTLKNSKQVILDTCGQGEQSWTIVKNPKDCTFKLINPNSEKCIGCYPEDGERLCDLRALDNCLDSNDYVWHKFLPLDDDTCSYTENMTHKAKDNVYKSLRFDSRVSAKAACNHLGYYCSGYMFNNNKNKPRYSILAGDMVPLGVGETYWSKTKDCDEPTRNAYFDQTYS